MAGAIRARIAARGWPASDESLHPLVAEVWKASERLAASGVLATPLLESRWLAEAPNGRHRPASVLLKLENRQVTGSFKARGATNKIASLTDKQLARGIATASSGNHALAVLYASHALKAAGRGPEEPPMVYLPTTAADYKVQELRKGGAHVVQHGTDFLDAEKAAHAAAAESGLTYVSAYDDLQVAAGQGTIALEVLAELPSTALLTIFVPVGGGGLIAGIGALLKSVRSDIHVVGCQPAASDVMQQSVLAGRIVDVPSGDTLSDGSAGGVDANAITFEPCCRFVDDWLTVSEPEIARAMVGALEQHDERLEGSAGVAIACYAKYRDAGKTVGRTCIIVCCGGNVSDVTMHRAHTMAQGLPLL